MTDAIDIGPTVEQARASWRVLEGAIERADEGRAEARQALEEGRPIFATLGASGWFDSSLVVLEQAAAGAAAGFTFGGPVGAVLGGAVGAVIAALSQPAVGVVSLEAVCTLPDGTQAKVYNEPRGCLCFSSWRPATDDEATAAFDRWYTISHPGYGYEYDRKRGACPRFGGDLVATRAWWEANRRREPIERAQIINECLPKYSATPALRAAAQVAFGGRWGDRWYWPEEELFGVEVGKIPAWVPVSQEVVTRWFLVAAGAGLGPVEVGRVAALTDPRLGVARASDRLEDLDATARRAALANACVLVLARSGGVVPVALAGLRVVEERARALGVADLGDRDIREAWLRLADPRVALLPEATTTTRRALPWAIGGALALGALLWWRRRRRGRGR